MQIKKGDTIFVISGKDRGKTGIISNVLNEKNKVVVTGIGISKHHLKPSRKNPHGGILEMPMPISASNVMILCPHCGKPTRIAHKITAKSKERICKKCQGNLDVQVKESASAKSKTGGKNAK